MQRSDRISQCVGCDLQVPDADPHMACPRCGSALLALPPELSTDRRTRRVATALRALRRRDRGPDR